MELPKALNALEPFLALSKSATSPRAAADLVARATSSPNTFVFTELLQTPQVQALAWSPDHELAAYIQLLEIFSYGTYTTYSAAASTTKTLPPLNDAQKLKLRQLSLLTLAKDACEPGASLSYARLLEALELGSARELEELVISAVYAGLLHAQLDPKHEVVHVNSVTALRDVTPGSSSGSDDDSNGGAIGGLLSSLKAWAGRCEETLQSLETQMSELRADADRRATEAAAWSEKIEKLIDEDQNQAMQGGGGHQMGGQHKGSSISGAGAAGDSIFSGASGQGPFAGNSAIANMIKGQRFGKRGSGHMDTPSGGGGDADDEAMDLDDEDDLVDGKKRASRRKL
ncbi:PCI domain-containing protein [Lasiosphaeria ovina]|uniref:PCI domain-containing protein n=1 Tax=Lasiosphaeria ovina TaxID=92902 RepID=A0AAE0NIY8_9PEZI|nr:PCI domain-containing protein [Lasiosphaeria ovina]